MKECYKPKTSYEIQKASEEYIWKPHIDEASVQDHFIAGAEWMQEKMIEKTTDWIRSHWREYINGPDKDGCISFGHWENDFKQAMEK